MKKYSFLFLFCFVTACAQTGQIKGKPEWVDNPYNVCDADELCAVGVGFGLNTAKADARNGIAKVFQTRLKSSFQESMIQNNDDFVSKINDYIAESSDVELEAVEITETYKSPDDVYALAVLNKPVAAKMTAQDIDALDEKMLTLMTDESPAAAVQAEKLYEERFALNQRYTVLTGNGMLESVTYNQIYGNKKAKIGKNHIYLMQSGEKNSSFEYAVRDVMKKNGYTFAKSKTAETPVVTISMTAEEQYFNVSGFVKYNFHFSMKAPDKKGKIIDVFAKTITKTGRTKKQALATALEDFKADLNDNILNLNF